MKSLLLVASILSLCALPVRAFEIELPPHYREDLEEKRQKEASALWSELDRGSIESAIREFIVKNPRYDGVPLDVAARPPSWQKKGRVITYGEWHVFLAEWEQSYPSLARIDWKKARLIVARSYDWKTKTLRADGDADIRLVFSVARGGPLFSRKITSNFESADYGETVLLLPFGGVELRKANRVAGSD